MVTPVIDSTAATSFAARSLAAMDDPAQAYFLLAWRARGAAHVSRPGLLEVERPDLLIQGTRAGVSSNAESSFPYSIWWLDSDGPD